ncbi:MAG: hypothetical protein Q9222_000718 [Ikaeria aurantiellina]
MPATFVRRPVSPLCFEPLRPDPDDIICLGSDAEETPEQHRNKRRRVEEAGLQYLSGKPLYIASARLRGPFPDSWRNPFETKKRRIEVVDIASESESNGRYLVQTAPHYERSPSARSSPPAPKINVAPTGDYLHPRTSVNFDPDVVSQESFVTATSEAPQEPDAKERSRAFRPQPSRWLKIGKVAVKPRFRSQSPTPTPRPRKRRTSPAQYQSRSSEAREVRHGLQESAIAPTAKRRLSQHGHHGETGYSGAERPRETALSSAREEQPIQVEEFGSNSVSPRAAGSLQANKGDPIALPASTNLPEFEYRYLPKKASESPEKRSFKEDPEAVKTRARAERKWRLSFTASRSIRSRNPPQSSPDGSQTPKLSRHGSSTKSSPSPHIDKKDSPSKSKGSPSDPPPKESVSISSHELGVLPEAQIVQDPVPKVPSGPSTEMLETDKLPSKFPSTDENDSYLGLSTPAAMLKAQRSFQKDVDSPVSESRARNVTDSHGSDSDQPLLRQRQDRDLVPAIPPKAELATPFAMSTQAMIDAVSPFAVTTAKKRMSHESRPELTPSGSRSSSPPSPTAYKFKAASLSMSSSSSPSPSPINNDPLIPPSALSKPASAITSFSIAPNGTMTEMFQQDGQQQQDYVMNDSDLEAAIEEAGSFLVFYRSPQAVMDWLDSLSEDWVSQPRSPHSEQLRRSSSALSAASPTSSTSQSRIPRFKSRPGADLPSNRATSSKRISSGLGDPRRKNILQERSSSRLNVSQSHAQEANGGTRNTGAKERKQSKQHSSVKSLPLSSQDTVQHRTSKASPAKENAPGSTPEWKRRVLQAKTGGTGPDLFGPIGLESIFKPPTVGRTPGSGNQKKRGKQYQPVTVDDFPSSPPAFPSELGSIERSGGTDRRPSLLLKQMDILQEVSEGDSKDDTIRHGDSNPEHALPERIGESRTSPTSLPAEEDHNEVLSQVLLPIRHGHDRVASSRSKLSTTARSHDSSPSARLRPSDTESNGPHESYAKPATSTSSPPIASRALLTDDWTNHSLPDDLSTGTDLYAANGGFVSIRRGGYSTEGSFQDRLLSPSLLPDFDAPELRSPSPTRLRPSKNSKTNITEESLTCQPRSAPVTPQKKHHVKSRSADELPSSGSPLKLFDKYDTFTNERLVRRISRFEQMTQESEVLQHDDGGSKIKDRVQAVTPRSRSPNPHDSARETKSPQSKRRVSNFGVGQLDHYPFHAQHPFDTKLQSRPSEPNAGSAPKRLDYFYQSSGVSVHCDAMDEVKVELAAVHTVNGKRLPYSPAKESQTKRRCITRDPHDQRTADSQRDERIGGSVTLHIETTPAQATDHVVVNPLPQKSTSIAGKKRKDARYNDDNQAADPATIASRHILQPRTSTPIRRASKQPMQGPGDHADSLLYPDHLSQLDQTPVVDLDHETQALAGELATFTLNMAQDMTHGGRKASVTTADFFNEAKQIMQLIRNQGRPQSNQGITEEPEPEDEDGQLQQPHLDQSTIDEFSRPPSREGGSLRRLREPVQVDARVASHLRKFEDTDDLGLALPSSAKSMHINHSHDPSSPAKSVDADFQDEASSLQSEPPNIWIRAQEHREARWDIVHRDRKDYTTATSSGTRSSQSHASSGPSSGRSVPTGSSHNSRSSGTTKAVIAPQVVSHLLSDNVGGMTFDHSKQVWIKRKDLKKTPGAGTRSRAGSDATEDMFRDIPDLSVDEPQEQQRTHGHVALSKVPEAAADQISSHDHADQPVNGEAPRPQARGGKGVERMDHSSAPSKFSCSASSEPVPDTRATSLGGESLATKAKSTQVQTDNAHQSKHVAERSEEVEHEISILEGRLSEKPRQDYDGRRRQPRVVTVAFSSPLVDHVQTFGLDDNGADSSNDGSDLDLADSPVRNDALSSSANQVRKASGFRKGSRYCSISRRASLSLARPMSRVDEDEELTFLQTIHGPSNAGLDLVVTTPLPSSRASLLQVAPSSAQASSFGFQLSPLSEFTVHQSDDLADRKQVHIQRHKGLLSTHEVEGKLSLAVQELVKKLTDIEPYEPFWDYIRHVNLRNRNLHSLHMLDEFCGHIEHLDVSDNQLSQLHGAPAWVRNMNASSNCLSSLTSWGHLQNLQYLDVSHNQIQSLAGFQSLVHLRELKLDGNQIESLDGILELEGLIKLRLRDNCVKSASFEACNLIREIGHLNHLPALQSLDLIKNSLESFCVEEGSKSLQELQLADNQLHALDIGDLPSLRFLDVDQNSISRITSLGPHRQLEILSWREQRLDDQVANSVLQYHECRNVRELYLSGNVIRSFAPDACLQDLRHLELASTGLQSFAEDFGLKCPNLRTLNVNFNGLSELRPLLGIVGLEKLYLAGNRISRLRRTASVLDRLENQLAEIDLRQNPLTLGYYNPQQPSIRTTEQQLAVMRNGLDCKEQDDSILDSVRRCSTYLLPRVESDADVITRERLDEETKLRRRVYELLLSLRCKNLRILDGLPLDRRKVTCRDGVWERLMELGVLTSKGRGSVLELEA